MRTPIALSILLALSTLPLAVAAGNMGADVTFDDATAESCESSSFWGSSSGSYQSNSSWYRWYQSRSGDTKSCESSTTTAAVTASDSQGELAYVGLGGTESSTEQSNNSNYESQSQYGTPWGDWYSNQYYEQSVGKSTSTESWRGATARAGGDEVNVGTACTTDEAENQHYGQSYTSSTSPYGDSQGGSGHSRYTHSESDDCRRGATTTVNDRTVSTGASNGCGYDQRYDSYYYYHYSQYGDYYENRGASESTSECRTGAFGEAAGQSAWAGRADECWSQNDWSTKPTSNGTYTYNSYGRNTCRDGALVEGPTGITVFVGTARSEDNACHESNSTYWCESYNSQQYGTVDLMWSQDPTGVDRWTFFVPLS